LGGLALDGEFPEDFAATLEAALQSRWSPALVIPISRHAASMRASSAPLIAVQGTGPSARDLAEMGIRAGLQPSRWIVALDDDLCANLFQKNADALATWRRIASYLKFAEDHAEWRPFAPFGNLGIIVDAAAKDPETIDDYLNLAMRRHVPYGLIRRSDLSAASIESYPASLRTHFGRFEWAVHRADEGNAGCGRIKKRVNCYVIVLWIVLSATLSTRPAQSVAVIATIRWNWWKAPL
jgi:hypothetical protein